ncbi:MAG TPA: hypothetical protein VHZ25_01970 [Acidobacteriaceae bacterium]|jgi:hypothetical protein|nr:hypothetical protein [Acidobacteriaceae bacterium]
MVRKIGFIVFLLLPAALIAQNSESATGGEASISAGVEFSSFNPDWGCANSAPFGCSDELYGPTAVFDFDLHQQYGIEGEARWLHWHGNAGQIESNYVVGPRYRIVRYRRLTGWAKLGFGGGWITTPDYPAAGSLKGSYFIYAPGGTVNYRLNRDLFVRADYEWQFWPSFVGPPTFNPTTGQVVQHGGGLTPNGLSVGLIYRFLGR